ncbi:MAG: magnesium transporter [Planctomycetota bacterium]|nr:magnesium transporter [Planctomycetota bacterium]
MINPILLPELRLMLAENDGQGLFEVATELHPATVADFTEGLSVEDTWSMLSHAPLGTQADIFSYYSNQKQEEMVLGGGRQRMGSLLEEMAPDNRVDLLKRLDDNVVQELLPLVAKAERHDIVTLLSYPEGSAGSFMNTEYASVPAEITAGEAIARLRNQAPDNEMIYYIFVLGPDRQLLGLVSLRDLILARPTTPVEDLMQRDVIAVRVDEDQEEVANKMARYDFLAMPVVDSSGRLVGIVTHDDIIDIVREEATEDAHRIAGVAPLTLGYLETGLLALTWKRGVWLAILFLTAMFTTTALQQYEDTQIEFTWMILFIPLIMSCGGNSGNQSATLIITALSTGDISLKDWYRVVRRELMMGLLLGVGLGIFGLIIANYYVGMPHALVVPVTVTLVVMCGTMVGSLSPLIFRRMGLDPALMSNPFVSGIIDILGIVIYMNVAILLL